MSLCDMNRMESRQRLHVVSYTHKLTSSGQFSILDEFNLVQLCLKNCLLKEKILTEK